MAEPIVASQVTPSSRQPRVVVLVATIGLVAWRSRSAAPVYLTAPATTGVIVRAVIVVYLDPDHPGWYLV